jgi:hypothetical protein
MGYTKVILFGFVTVLCPSSTLQVGKLDSRLQLNWAIGIRGRFRTSLKRFSGTHTHSDLQSASC